MTGRQVGLLALVVSSFASAAPTTVALDVSTVDAASFEALDGVALEKTATVRLVQEGFAVIAPTASPDVLVAVSVSAEPRSIVLSGRGPGGASTRSIPWGNETQAELRASRQPVGVEVLARGDGHDLVAVGIQTLDPHRNCHAPGPPAHLAPLHE